MTTVHLNRFVRFGVTGFLVAILFALLAGTALAAAPNPAYGSATVDGSTAEWNLDPSSADFFAYMGAGFNPADLTKRESQAYLRYDCATQTMVALVLNLPGFTMTNSVPPTDHWIAINTINNKVAFTNFAFVMSGANRVGWEASFSLPLAPAPTSIGIHAQVIDASGTPQTSGTQGQLVGLSVNCSATVNVSKTATAIYTQNQQTTWTITKTVTPNLLNLFEGQTGTVTYTVHVSPTVVVTNFYTVAGTINMTNPGSSGAVIAGITDIAAGTQAQTLNCSPYFTSLPYTLGAGQSISCTYQVQMPAKIDGTNTVTVSLSNGTPGVGTAAFAFPAQPNSTQTTGSPIDVNDTRVTTLQGGSELGFRSPERHEPHFAGVEQDLHRFGPLHRHQAGLQRRQGRLHH